MARHLDISSKLPTARTISESATAAAVRAHEVLMNTNMTVGPSDGSKISAAHARMAADPQAHLKAEGHLPQNKTSG